MRCSSCQRSAVDSPASTFASSSCASSSCLRARLALCGRFRLLAAELLPALDRGLDRADHVESLLGQLVVLAVEDLREAANRVLELHELARRAGELRGREERLREEALDLAG